MLDRSLLIIVVVAVVVVVVALLDVVDHTIFSCGQSCYSEAPECYC